MKHVAEPPLKTSSGLRIGGAYKPPAHDYNSAEDVFWQGIMLGIEPEFSDRRILGWGAYCVAVVAFMILLKAFL